jgi:hypothetical protein
VAWYCRGGACRIAKVALKERRNTQRQEGLFDELPTERFVLFGLWGLLGRKDASHSDRGSGGRLA